MYAIIFVHNIYIHHYIYIYYLVIYYLVIYIIYEEIYIYMLVSFGDTHCWRGHTAISGYMTTCMCMEFLVTSVACWTRTWCGVCPGIIWSPTTFFSPLNVAGLFSFEVLAWPEVKSMLLSAHPRTFSLRGLQKYCLAVCLRWVEPSFMAWAWKGNVKKMHRCRNAWVEAERYYMFVAFVTFKALRLYCQPL